MEPDPAERLLRWFALHGRDLPWRTTRDPWEILVSEVMLQQTQVGRVLDRWPRFLARFPSAVACADASPAEVIDEWAGLGYNRRAVNLHRSAVVVRDQHGGHFPDALTDLLALPGVGQYTARAVRVFAFEADEAVVDTNIGRTLARLVNDTLTPSVAQDLADSLVPEGEGWAWNQAVMELGALVCRPDPRCESCPLAPSCRWQLVGRPEPDPSRGSAAVSKPQSRFDGSDRQGRGRLVDRLRAGPVDVGDAPAAMGWPDDPDRAERVLSTLLTDGLVERSGRHLRLVSG
jgi:A/G-specific adenine glycosylase